MEDLLAPSGRTVHTTEADGTVRDWLVSPVHGTPADDLEAFLRADGDPWDGRWVLTNGPDVAELKERLAAAHPIDGSQDLPEPVEGGPLVWTAGAAQREDEWRRVRTGTDGLVDWSQFCFTPEYRYALAATVLEVDQAEWRTLEVSSTGPFVLWLDGVEVLRGTRVSYMEPETQRIRLRLPSRTTSVHLATWQVAFRECRHVARLRVAGLPVRVAIPSPGADETAARIAETVLEHVASPSWAQHSDVATLTAPPGVGLQVRVAGQRWQRVRADDDGTVPVPLSGAGSAPSPGEHPVDPSDADQPHDLAGPSRSAEGSEGTGASLLTTGEQVIEAKVDDERCPQVRSFPVALLPADLRTRPHGDPADWQRELLAHAAHPTAGKQGRGVVGVLARHALDPAITVQRRDLAAALELITSRGDCADFEILALLHVWHRIPAAQWEPGLRETVAQALVGMKYWITQPGLDAMCYFTENHQLVWHAAEHLAGQTFADSTFAVEQRTGSAHSRVGRDRAAGWLVRKLRGGYSEFDSNAYLAIDTLALATLVEFSQDEALVTAARTLLDKTLLTLATNSWRGIHGTAHGRAYVHSLRSARFENTSPILRLIAGVGTLNEELLPATVLALANKYRIPQVLRELAGSEPEQWWARQVYRGDLAFERDLLERPYRSDLRIWRTPDVMLASVQDYRSGLPGLQEHVWGATLGPETQVFITHPANSDTGNSARPNAWAGHRVLPRVHQHRGALVHLQRFTPTDPIAATHLWLPVAHVDEWVQKGDWIAARRGSGYVALATPAGVRPVRSGETAWQEWEPVHGGAAWIAVVGRTAVDGPFEEWVQDLERGALAWHPRGPQDPGVVLVPPGGPRLECTFDTSFLIDGRPADVCPEGYPAVEPHLDNPAVHLPFGAETAEVSWAGATMRLDIGAALRAVE
ncbi:hypothetical protein ACO0LV_09845 [Pseudactinotalea sp. Z1739]|uniref:hypothetical protein n=1 Tax=Pseudactinotalea sp. Z1739 TaxID=3413028 RepID=UPI003C7AC86E